MVVGKYFEIIKIYRFKQRENVFMLVYTYGNYFYIGTNVLIKMPIFQSITVWKSLTYNNILKLILFLLLSTVLS